MHVPRWTTMLLAMAISSSCRGARRIPPALMSGPMRCGINGYGWPLSANDAPIAADAGTMEIVSDGNGKFTSGQMTRHIGDDTRMAGTNVCIFDLENGSYVQHSDGTTTNILSWKLRAGSDPHCGAIVTKSKNLGYVEEATRFPLCNLYVHFLHVGKWSDRLCRIKSARSGDWRLRTAREMNAGYDETSSNCDRDLFIASYYGADR